MTQSKLVIRIPDVVSAGKVIVTITTNQRPGININNVVISTTATFTDPTAEVTCYWEDDIDMVNQERIT